MYLLVKLIITGFIKSRFDIKKLITKFKIKSLNKRKIKNNKSCK